MSETKEKESYLKKLAWFDGSVRLDQLSRVSVIIPSFNCSQSIALTVESILSQDYPHFEIVVVDASSTDRTLEILTSYQEARIRIYSVTGYQRYGMINRGISQATGQYINILFPGDFYIHQETIKFMMYMAIEHESPHLVYCGTLLRDGVSEVKILYRNLTLDLLRKGQQPTSLQSCWFRADVFKIIGKFNTDFLLRGGYDLLCRFMLNRKMQFASSSRVLTDYDLRLVSRRMVIRHFWETFKIVNKYFGRITALRWLFRQKDMSRFLRLWIRNIKVVFLGR